MCIDGIVSYVNAEYPLPHRRVYIYVTGSSQLLHIYICGRSKPYWQVQVDQRRNRRRLVTYLWNLVGVRDIYVLTLSNQREYLLYDGFI